jgi:hypothetical protein
LEVISKESIDRHRAFLEKTIVVNG